MDVRSGFVIGCEVSGGYLNVTFRFGDEPEDSFKGGWTSVGRNALSGSPSTVTCAHSD